MYVYKQKWRIFKDDIQVKYYNKEGRFHNNFFHVLLIILIINWALFISIFQEDGIEKDVTVSFYLSKIVWQ